MQRPPQPDNQSVDETGLRLRLLRDYTRYLYEEEQARASRLSGSIRTYLLFIGSTFAATVAALKWMAVRPVDALSSVTTFIDRMLFWTPLIATLALLISLLFTVLVSRVWRLERLCSPKSFVLSVTDKTDQEILAEMIANFVVATERNSEINERKASLLRMASLMYRVALLLLTSSALVYIFDKVGIP